MGMIVLDYYELDGEWYGHDKIPVVLGSNEEVYVYVEKLLEEDKLPTWSAKEGVYPKLIVMVHIGDRRSDDVGHVILPKIVEVDKIKDLIRLAETGCDDDCCYMGDDKAEKMVALLKELIGEGG